jgi:cbb3-type cytochrome oxidase subunit 1
MIMQVVTGCVILAASKINRAIFGLTWKDKSILNIYKFIVRVCVCVCVLRVRKLGGILY